MVALLGISFAGSAAAAFDSAGGEVEVVLPAAGTGAGGGVEITVCDSSFFWAFVSFLVGAGALILFPGSGGVSTFFSTGSATFSLDF